MNKSQLKKLISEVAVEEGIGDIFKRKKKTTSDEPSEEFLANQYLQNLRKTKMGKQASDVRVRHDPEFAKAFARGPKPKDKMEETEEVT